MKKEHLEEILLFEKELSFQSLTKELQPLIESALEESEIGRKRKGTFLQPVFLIWIVLTATLCRNLNYAKVIEFLIAPLRWLCLKLPRKLVAEGTISKARSALGMEVFKNLFYKTVRPFDEEKADFYGMKSVGFDGTTCSMPDTSENRKTFKKASNQKELNGFPLTRVLCLMSLSLRLILDVEFAPYAGKHTGESTLMMAILKRFKGGSLPYLFHFDALFYSFLLLRKIRDRGDFF